MISATVRVDGEGGSGVSVSGEAGGAARRVHGSLEVSVGEVKPGHWRLAISNKGDVALNKGRTPSGGKPVKVSGISTLMLDRWVASGLAGLWIPETIVSTRGRWLATHPIPVPHTMISGSDESFALNGGAKIWADFTAPGVEAHPAPTEMPERCRSWMGRGEAWEEIGEPNPYRWPALKAFLAKWRDRGAKLDGRYHYGMLPWGASGPGNHYDQLAAMITAYFEAPDSEYWDFICAHARHRLTKELIASNPGDPFFMRFHYEKTDGPGRQYGSGNMAVPVYSHEWNAGLLMWLDITGDPSASFLMKGHGAALVGQDPARVWNGAGGIRQAGWFLRQLRAAYHFAPDEAHREEFRTAARAMLGHCFGLVKGHDYWPNRSYRDYLGGAFAPWQQALMNAEVAGWMHLGVGREHSSELWRLMRWQADNAWSVVEGRLHVPYLWSKTTPDYRFPMTINGWCIPQAWILAQDPKYAHLRDAVIPFVKAAGRTEAQMVSGDVMPEPSLSDGAHGGSALKIMASTNWLPGFIAKEAMA